MKYFYIYWRWENLAGSISYDFVTEVEARNHQEAIKKAEKQKKPRSK